MRKSIRGFTLIEIMVVVAIIGVLVSLLLPNFLKARYEATLTTCEQNERELATSLILYSNDNNANFPSTGSALLMLVPNYSREIPWCPTSGTKYAYQATSDYQGFTIYCTGEHIELLGGSAGPVGSSHIPEYSSSGGLINK